MTIKLSTCLYWAAVICALLALTAILGLFGCSGTEYANVRRLKTNWMGQVTEVDGGTSKTEMNPLLSATSGGPWEFLQTLWGWTVVGGILLIILCIFFRPIRTLVFSILWPPKAVSVLRARKAARQGISTNP